MAAAGEAALASLCVSRKGLIQPELARRAVDPVSLPIIDLGPLRMHSLARPLVVQEIGRACQSLGCFQVTNHGIDESVMSGALVAASDFFRLSPEEKAQFESKDPRRPVRYAGYNKDANEARELLKHYAHPLDHWIQRWPIAPPDYREIMGRYATHVRKLALLLTDAITESLGLGPSYLKDELEKGMQVMAINSYPEQSRSRSRSPTSPSSCSTPIGLAPHSDYGFLTVLLQTCTGLHIFDRRAESWKEVPGDVPCALHVHIGDHLEVMSNGKYERLVHRAVLNAEKRISVASIHGLAMHEKVTTAKELVDERNPKRYRESSFQDFVDFLSSSSNRSYIDSLIVN